MKFTEAKLEQAIIDKLEILGYPHVLGAEISRDPSEVLIEDDLQQFLASQYRHEEITPAEIDSVIRQLRLLSASDLYESNKAIMKMVADGFLLKREDRSQKDLYIQLIDYSTLPAYHVSTEGKMATEVAECQPVYQSADTNIYKMVNQLEIIGYEKRIPDGILYINGLPLVVFEFKSAIRTEATIHDAFEQLTIRYRRDIPELFKYNAFCVISDGVNNRLGSFFAPYEFYYGWRKITGNELLSKDGIDSLHTMIQGLFDPNRLRGVIHNFIYLPDSSNRTKRLSVAIPSTTPPPSCMRISRSTVSLRVMVRVAPILAQPAVASPTPCCFWCVF